MGWHTTDQDRYAHIQMSLDTLGEHVSTLEQQIGANKDNLQDLMTQNKKLTKDNAYLMDKIQDLENQVDLPVFT